MLQQVRAQEKVRQPFKKPDHSFKRYTQDVLIETCQCFGRDKYRAIVVIAWLSDYWDGWKSNDKRKRKRGRLPVKEARISRRMMADYGYSEKTIQSTLSDLLQANITHIGTEFQFNGAGRKTRTYFCPWMEAKSKAKKVRIFHGLLTSDKFLRLGITTQAILILLHIWLKSSSNITEIRNKALIEMGISRRIISDHLSILRHAGLIEYMEGNKYRFTWLDDGGHFEGM